jgi:DNA repair exonuclease SbcCD ATPase subunit
MSNDITNVQTLDDQLLAQAAPVLNPEKYSAAVFEGHRKQLAKAKRDAAKTEAYDITTGAGMTVAKALRAAFRDIRTSAENVRKERKAPIIQIGKLIDAKYKELEAEIEPLELKYDREIKAEEQRKEDEKQRKLAEERARVEAIENRIANIRGAASRLAGAGSDAIKAELNTWTLLRLEPADYQEYLEDALTAVNTTIDQLTSLLATAEAREAEARRVAAEREELARLRAEQEAREKAEREAAAERERLARAEAQRVEAERRAAAEREAELQRQIAEMKAQMAEAQMSMSKPAAATIVPIEEDHTGKVVGAALVSTDEPAQDSAIVEKLDAGAQVFVDLAAEGSDKTVSFDVQVRPTDGEMIEVLAIHYQVSEDTITGWLKGMDL